MNKAVPWNVKGVGFDAREVARTAAKRAGLPVGEWLDSVITERASDLGVAIDDISPDDRLDALAARLAGVAESVQSGENRGEARSQTMRRSAPEPTEAGISPMAQHDDEDLERDLDRVSGTSYRRVANGSTVAYDSTPHRAPRPTASSSPQRRDVLDDWAEDAFLDEALDLVRKRAETKAGQLLGERQRQNVAALAREVDRLNTGEPGQRMASRPIEEFEDRVAEWQKRMTHPKKDVRSRPVRDAADSVAERLEQLEARLAQRDAALANRPIVSALNRLENRFDHLAKRNLEGERESIRVEVAFRELDDRLRNIAGKLDGGATPASPKSHAEIERIDSKLAAILARLGPSQSGVDAATTPVMPLVSAARPWIDPVANAGRSGERKVARGVIADIAQRQADLDAGQHRGMLLGETSYPSIGQSQREARPARIEPIADHLDQGPDPVSDEQTLAFKALQDAFAGLAERLETRLDRKLGADQRNGDELKSLKTGIAGLEERLDVIKQHTIGKQAETAILGSVTGLHQEIVALSAGVAELAAHQSKSTLDQAVRMLGERLDSSRLEGVSEAVVAPIEQLARDLQHLMREGDPRAALAGIEAQLKSLDAKTENLAALDLTPEFLRDMQRQSQEVRDLLLTAAEHAPVATRIEQEVGKLITRVDRLAELPSQSALPDLEHAVDDIRTMFARFSSADVLQELSQKLDLIAERVSESDDRMEFPDVLFDGLSRRIDEVHSSLAERLDAKVPVNVDLRPIEAMIGGLSGKIDGLHHSSSDVHALGGLVRGLAAQIEDARLPNADAKALDALESQVGRLAERLDRSDASLDAISSLERLIGELFHQLEETRTAAIDAADTAARTAAQDTLRAALATGSERGSQTALAVDQIGQELSELRKAQQGSEKRVHATLLALNQTLERMVDRLVSDAPASGPSPQPAEPAIAASEPDEGADLILRSEHSASAAAVAASRAELDVPLDLTESNKVSLPNVTAAPAVEIGRTMPGDPAPDVSPLIAAARRAAQAAQASALSSAKDVGGKGRAPAANLTVPAAKASASFFSFKRRSVLLSLAGVVVLLGAAEVARLSGDKPATMTTTEAAIAPDAAAPDQKTASVAPEAAVPPKTSGSVAESTPVKGSTAPAPVAQASTDDNASKSAKAAIPAADAAAKTDTTIAGLPAGLRDLALGGDAAAQYEVGVRFAEAHGVARDLGLAATWFERAAKQGLAPAQYRLGSLYEKGLGVIADPTAAVSWYERAANQGNIRAMHNLAVMAAEGAGSKPDYVKAALWFNKAATFGVRDSQFNLAILDARGLGGTQNLSQAYTWFSIASGQGDADAARKRDDVAAKLDAKQVAAAKVAADAFKPTPADHAANEVSSPAGGWDAASPKTVSGSAVKDEGRGRISAM